MDLDLQIFPSADKKKWNELATKQLKGVDPMDALQWKNEAGIQLSAYYDNSDTQSLNYLHDFFTNLPSHDWKLYEEIEVIDVEQANRRALIALMGGCDGIIFQVDEATNRDLLFKDIDLNICDVSIKGSPSFQTKDLSGFTLFNGGNCYEAIHSLNPIDRIVDVLQNVGNSEYIYRYTEKDFFLEIACIRALRYLLNNMGSDHVHIHTYIPLHENPEQQWFLNTTSGLASILGGSHSIAFPTATGDPRISRNTGNLIREESKIATYTDQCGGSYYIETLTDQIIKRVNASK